MLSKLLSVVDTRVLGLKTSEQESFHQAVQEARFIRTVTKRKTKPKKSAKEKIMDKAIKLDTNELDALIAKLEAKQKK